jgi:hypothetical protein
MISGAAQQLSFFFQELQNLFCLFARGLPVALCPASERLWRNADRFGHLRGMLYNDVPVITESGELNFSRLHGQR